MNPATESYRRVSVAPMMDWTDRHCRYFMRLLSPRVLLYTEMVTANAIHYGDSGKILRFSDAERPVALQVGGSDPKIMAGAAARGAEFGYDEININVGCPSERVQNGRFGACLMASPETVAECVRAMRAVTDLPITVKSRIGIDDLDSYGFLEQFVDTVAAAGCKTFIVHARIAILGGMSPKENRALPPLNYERVYRLKQNHPDLQIILNGGIADLDQVEEALQHVDGVMIGRRAYHHPYMLAELEQLFDPDFVLPDRRDVVEQMIPYIETQLQQGLKLGSITRHMLGLFAGMPGARSWRRYISEHAYRDGAGIDVVLAALDAMPVAA